MADLAGAQADHGKVPGPAAGDGHGRDGVLALRHNDLSARPGGEKGRRLGDARRRDRPAHLGARVGHVHSGQLGGREGAHGEAEVAQGRRPPVDRRHFVRHSAFGCLDEEVEDGVERRVAARADAGHEAGAARVRRGRHHGLGAQSGAHTMREQVAATLVPAGDGHGEPACVVDAHHRRVAPLVVQEGRNDAGGGADGEEQHEGVDLAPPGAYRVGRVPVDGLPRQPVGHGSAACCHRHRDHVHSSGPHATNTGFSAARRNEPSGRRAPRDTLTSTR